eukprot:GHVU01116145.1.p1 GENE.GHVU01116145.1~~GHVU01116145.1.p1  ORF type:complete len:140 (-),score=9.25 GHVU01116145.1:237-605(-)
MAEAACFGGATAATEIYTVSGIMDCKPDGTPYPSVGTERFTTQGGMSGDNIRPMGLCAVSNISKRCPNLAIMGSGGVSSGRGDSALQYLKMGATVVQVTSADVPTHTHHACTSIYTLWFALR